MTWETLPWQDIHLTPEETRSKAWELAETCEDAIAEGDADMAATCARLAASLANKAARGEGEVLRVQRIVC